LEALLKTVEMACSLSKVERRKGLQVCVDDAKSRLERKIKENFEDFEAGSLVRLLSAISDFETHWTSRAEKLLKITGSGSKGWEVGWYRWHPSTFLAFCKRKGNWKVKNKGSISWNERLLEIMHEKDVEIPFSKIQTG